MVDNSNPTNQFHPYVPVKDTPHSELPPRTGLGGILDKISGMSTTADVRGSVDKARGFAQKNPGAVLGGMAALAIGLGMLRGRGRK